MTLTRTTVTGNATAGSGGGIRNTGTGELNETTVSLNTAGADGGGILNNDGTLIIVRSTIAENTAGADGGGIENYSGSIEIDSSTVSGNATMAGGGGAIENPFPAGTLSLTNTTVSGNSSIGRGAIENAGIAVVTASTLSLNVADGTVLWDGRCFLDPSCPPGALTIRNTILDGHCISASGVLSLGGNIEVEGNTCGLDHPMDRVWFPAPALNLLPLGDNGGPTLTRALGAGSDAIDWIDPIECVDAAGLPLTTDQRGVLRPQGPACDVGSVEVVGVPGLCDGVDCDDQNECTDDVCDPATGLCESTPAEDGTACSVGTCQAGVCTYAALDIDLPEGFEAFVFYDGILVPDGIVVVSNEILYVVNEVGPDGPFVLTATRGGTYSTDDALSTIGPPFDSPDDLEAGEDNQLFIADGQAQTVFRLPESGGEPIPFATPATTGFDLFNPFGIEVVPPSFDGPSIDPGDLIVADNARILWAVNQETGLANVFVQGAVFEGGPLRAEFGPDGTLYVSENFAPGTDLGRIVTVASDGTVVPFVEQIIGGRGGLAVHPKNGDVYFNCGTELCRVVYGTTTPEPFASNVGRSQGLEFSPSGLSLFVSASGERNQVIEIRGDEQSWGVPGTGATGGTDGTGGMGGNGGSGGA
jgi:hypothetical protein